MFSAAVISVNTEIFKVFRPEQSFEHQTLFLKEYVFLLLANTKKKAHCSQTTQWAEIGKVARLNARAFLNETDLPQTIPFTR